MKKPYIQPEITIDMIETANFIATSEVNVKGDYSDDNETENGGAGVLSGQQDTWEEEF